MFYYYNFFIKSLILNKFFLEEKKFIFFYRMHKLIISIYIKNLKNYHDDYLSKAVSFLQTFTNFHVKIIFFSYYEKKKKILAAKLFVSLSTKYLYNFLSFFSCHFIHFLKKKQFFFKSKFSNNSNFFFSLKDISIMDFLPANYYD